MRIEQMLYADSSLGKVQAIFSGKVKINFAAVLVDQISNERQLRAVWRLAAHILARVRKARASKDSKPSRIKDFLSNGTIERSQKPLPCARPSAATFGVMD
jgi:hypothetical protein